MGARSIPVAQHELRHEASATGGACHRRTESRLSRRSGMGSHLARQLVMGPRALAVLLALAGAACTGSIVPSSGGSGAGSGDSTGGDQPTRATAADPTPGAVVPAVLVRRLSQAELD